MYSRFIFSFAIICALHVVAQPAAAQINYRAGYNKVPPGTGNFYNGLRSSQGFYSGLSSTKYRYGTKYNSPSISGTYRKHTTSSVPTHLHIPRYSTLTPTRLYSPYYGTYKRAYPSTYPYRSGIYSTGPAVRLSPIYPKRP